jgi:RNA polymerase sigma factor (sigma-70 family)
MTGSKPVAEEIVQDIFLHVWLNRTGLTKIENPDNYFFTVVHRKVYKYFKKMSIEHNVRKMLSESSLVDNTTDEMVLSRESKRLVDEAVAKLPPQQQLVFRRSKQDGLSREQIAEELHLSPHTVRNHLADAIRSIRAYISHATLLYLLLFSSHH